MLAAKIRLGLCRKAMQGRKISKLDGDRPAGVCGGAGRWVLVQGGVPADGQLMTIAEIILQLYAVERVMSVTAIGRYQSHLHVLSLLPMGFRRARTTGEGTKHRPTTYKYDRDFSAAFDDCSQVSGSATGLVVSVESCGVFPFLFRFLPIHPPSGGVNSQRSQYL